jgi:Phospholipase_D-nuclease N-terminal
MQPDVVNTGAASGLASVCCFAYMVPVLLGVAGAVLWIVALVDLLQRADSEFPNHQPGSNDKVVWILVVLFLNGIGALVYYLMVMRPYPRHHR